MVKGGFERLPKSSSRAKARSIFLFDKNAAGFVNGQRKNDKALIPANWGHTPSSEEACPGFNLGLCVPFNHPSTVAQGEGSFSRLEEQPRSQLEVTIPLAVGTTKRAVGITARNEPLRRGRR